jgi:hypothetical protein
MMVLLLLLSCLAMPPAVQTQAADRSRDTAASRTQIEMSRRRELEHAERAALLAVRESVWRAWFAGDTRTLERLLPPELITLDSSGQFGSLTSTLNDSRGFAASGGKLARLVFPRTEVQAYGATVILYTSYEMDLVTGGATRTERGVATEVFVQQPGGSWLHTGWQLTPAPRN